MSFPQTENGTRLPRENFFQPAFSRAKEYKKNWLGAWKFIELHARTSKLEYVRNYD